MSDRTDETSKSVILHSLKSNIKCKSLKRYFRNGQVIVRTIHNSEPPPESARRDTFGNTITRSKQHKIRISESVTVIEVENWKKENGPRPSALRCTVCQIM